MYIYIFFFDLVKIKYTKIKNISILLYKNYLFFFLIFEFIININIIIFMKIIINYKSKIMIK